MSNTTAKDAFGFDALSTYTDDGLGINALPDSEKYKKGIRENTTGKSRTIAIVANCPDCDFYYKNRSLSHLIMGTN